jgi:hypothetical protein
MQSVHGGKDVLLHSFLSIPKMTSIMAAAAE